MSLAALAEPRSTHLPDLSMERGRVARHLLRAERAARARDTSILDPVRQIVRTLLLDELTRYRRRARFPLNLDFGEPTPYFVDANGTRCAVAHLLAVGGEPSLVERIARGRNNARVRELADEPRLLAWLEAAGLTVEEAAAIQPEYCVTNHDCVCRFVGTPHNAPPATVLDGYVIDGSAARAASIRVEKIHGDVRGYVAGNVITARVPEWDGTLPQRVLVPVYEPGTDGALWEPVGLVVTEAGTRACGDEHCPKLQLELEPLVAALQSPDCRRHLDAVDPNWSCMTCGFPDLGEYVGCVEAGADAGVDARADSGSSITSDAASDVGTTDAGAREPGGAAGGCSVLQPVGAPTSIGILLALVGAITARAVARRGRR